MIGVVAFPGHDAYVVYNNTSYSLRENTHYAYVDGGEGNDLLFSVGDQGVVIRGGPGNDWISTGNTIYGRGENVIYGGTGNDTYFGDLTRNYWVEEPDPFGGFTTDILGTVIVLGLTDADNTVEIEGSFALIDGISSLSWTPGTFSHLVIAGDDGDDRVSVQGSDVQVIFYGGQGQDSFVTDNALDIFYQDDAPRYQKRRRLRFARANA
jgi:hypothetical protein